MESPPIPLGCDFLTLVVNLELGTGFKILVKSSEKQKMVTHSDEGMGELF